MTPIPPSPNDPLEFQEWTRSLEQSWQAGLVSNPQAVAVILRNDCGEVLLLLRDDNSNISFPNAWTLPGGVVESGETPEHAARRELLEETSLDLDLLHWKTYLRKSKERRFLIEQHVFVGMTRETVDEMILGEGQALRYFRRDELPALPIAFDFSQLLNHFFETDSINMTITNNVTRLLDSRCIPYTAYELPAEKLGAVEAAAILGVDADQVFKTIVVTREGKGKPILAVTPGSLAVDLKLLSKAVGEKKLTLPTEKDAERITGLQAGGISPLALLNRGFEVVIDETAILFDEIYISGGQRGLNIRLPVDALVEITGAAIAEFAR